MARRKHLSTKHVRAVHKPDHALGQTQLFEMEQQVGRNFSLRIAAAAAAACMMLSGPAAARSAAIQPSVVNPWVAFSAFASSASSSALCSASSAGAAASMSAQGTAPGCVFPQIDAPVASPVAESPVVPAAPPAVAAAGFGALPILLGLAGAAVVAALLLGRGGNGNDNIDVEPISPKP